MFDIDHFKSINDTRGHLTGDAVLRQMAALAAANVRRDDVLARVGGEEFALLVPEIPVESARHVAEKLRTIVASTPFRFDEGEIAVTASFGVAGITPDAPVSPMELYRRADERLYHAKKGGRNRVM